MRYLTCLKVQLFCSTNDQNVSPPLNHELRSPDERKDMRPIANQCNVLYRWILFAWQLSVPGTMLHPDDSQFFGNQPHLDTDQWPLTNLSNSPRHVTGDGKWRHQPTHSSRVNFLQRYRDQRSAHSFSRLVAVSYDRLNTRSSVIVSARSGIARPIGPCDSVLLCVSHLVRLLLTAL